ncbi:MAG: relaxase domain-containing protein, partial [Actinobacteria bacterium]|nr:relaxase domain-containing protein [Actinomycetota bacterium]
MLSIGKLANGQQKYYERQVAQGQDDYYSGRGEAPGEWVGRGAGALGLAGRVEAARFNALAAGIDPSDPELQRTLRDDGRSSKVAAYDLTFSAPKSVSVLYATADQETAGQLVEAHEAAVRGALAYVEDEAVRVRRGHAGAEEHPGVGVVGAAYRHRMSRALDPQLHTHVVCANVTRGPDGRWTALHGAPLYREAKTAGFLYQAHLRHEVSRRLGLAWGPVTKGSAELADVPAEVLPTFSRRRAQIAAREVELAAEGRSLDRRGRERVAYDTRQRKDYGREQDTPSWREEVRARAAEHGLAERDVETVLEAGRARLQRGPEDEDLNGRVRGALGDHLAGEHGLTEKANAFAGRDALQQLAAAARHGASVDAVRGAGQTFTARGDVSATQTGGWTTTQLVASERRLIAAAVGRAGERTGVVDAAVLERALASADRPLSDQQAAAVRAIATSGNGVDVVEALAGTGKTYTAGVLRQVYQDAGHPVVGLAPTGRAVRELTEEAGVPAWTIDRALIDHERYADAIPQGAVVLVDEAGMAATRPTERILELAQAAQAKVVAIGDSGQLPSVQAGGWMRAVGDRVGRHELTAVVRQRDTTERRALGLLHEGRPEGWLGWAQDHDRLAVHTDQPAATAALEEWQAAAGRHGPAQAVLIARDNATREHLNDQAREHQRAQGAL